MWPAYEQALKGAGAAYAMHTYPGTQHGFHNNSTPRYNEAAAKLCAPQKLDPYLRNNSMLFANALRFVPCRCGARTQLMMASKNNSPVASLIRPVNSLIRSLLIPCSDLRLKWV